jgi:hypothetical protein
VNLLLRLRAYNLTFERTPRRGGDNVRALKMAEDACRVQFIKGGYLSMTLITTHRPTFSTALSSNPTSLTMGRACAPIR